MCEARYFAPVFAYAAPPKGETQFAASGGDYRREVSRCGLCGHFVSVHGLSDDFYREQYIDGTYAEDGLRTSFERITALPPERSDNHWRAQRVLEFAGARRGTVLDVGSGLCVFLHRLKAEGWRGTALDPDPRAVEHARSVVGVAAICGDYMETDDLGQFDVVSFNKVLEHVRDPVAMLARSAANLADGGFVYIEVPDGDAALAEGPEREEFFIEHRHVFSPASLALLAARAGFSPARIVRLREPSTKFTLCAFLLAVL